MPGRGFSGQTAGLPGCRPHACRTKGHTPVGLRATGWTPQISMETNGISIECNEIAIEINGFSMFRASRCGAAEGRPAGIPPSGVIYIEDGTSVSLAYIQNATSVPPPHIEDVASVPCTSARARLCPAGVRLCPAARRRPAASGGVRHPARKMPGNRQCPAVSGGVRRGLALPGSARQMSMPGVRRPADPPGRPAVSG